MVDSLWDMTVRGSGWVNLLTEGSQSQTFQGPRRLHLNLNNQPHKPLEATCDCGSSSFLHHRFWEQQVRLSNNHQVSHETERPTDSLLPLNLCNYPINLSLITYFSGKLLLGLFSGFCFKSTAQEWTRFRVKNCKHDLPRAIRDHIYDSFHHNYPHPWALDSTLTTIRGKRPVEWSYTQILAM